MPSSQTLEPFVLIVFGSINLDMTFAVPALPTPGETVIGPAVQVQPGGKGANQAVAAARDGAAVAMAGAVGRDGAADTALAGLVAAGVDLSRVVRTDVSTGAAAICVDPAGRNQIAVGTGANAVARAGQVEDALLGAATTVLLQMEVDAAETANLIRRARTAGARIVLNLAPAAALDGLDLLDWLIVNEVEAAWLARLQGCVPTAAGLHAALGTGVVRTLGAQGVEAEPGGYRVPAHPTTVVDTTGAGDCFAGVFAAALDRGHDVRTALHRANVAAGLSCARAGSQVSLPHAAEIDRTANTA